MREATFRAERHPTSAILEAVAASAPANPFFARAYVTAQIALGEEPVVLGLWSGETLLAGCPAYLRYGRLRGRLHITSIPPTPPSHIFWSGVLGLCHRERLPVLTVDSYGSAAAELSAAPGSASIPGLAGEIARRTRTEFVLTLCGAGVSSRLTSNHRRNVARARTHGVSVRRTREIEACTVHDRLVHTSLHRRVARGEMVSAGSDLERYAALLRAGSGELFQATHRDEVLSSLLVLRAKTGAYYQSAGTSREGMAIGASHFLVSSVVSCLHDEGLRIFNLGGADSDAKGLRRFKEGFGAVPIALEAAQFSTEHALLRALRSAVQSSRPGRGR